jgi:hypothetical protein
VGRKQVVIFPLDEALSPFQQTGIHSYITMDRTEKAARVAVRRHHCSSRFPVNTSLWPRQAQNRLKAHSIASRCVSQAGALLRVTQEIWHDRRQHFQFGFILAKPPSHHCTPNEAFLRYDKGSYDLDGLTPELKRAVEAGEAVPNGYCHLNSIATAVAYLLNLPPLNGEEGGPYRPRKVVIFDVDVHLGDGTESMFWSNPDVYHVDFHEDASDLTDDSDATLTGDPVLAPGSNLSVAIEGVGAEQEDSTKPASNPGVDSIMRYKRAVREAIPKVTEWLQKPGTVDAGGLPTPLSGADAPAVCARNARTFSHRMWDLPRQAWASCRRLTIGIRSWTDSDG